MTAASTATGAFRELGERFGNAWNRFWFTPADPLPLCLLRVLAGSMALYLHATYTPDLLRFFGANGLLPVETVRQLRGDGFALSYLDYLSGGTELRVAHVLGFVVLACFTLGFFTRTASVGALVVVLSYIHRGPWLTHLVEPILAFVLIYLCLAPCGRYLSIDRWLALRNAARRGVPPASPERQSVAANVALRLLQIHLALVYLMMAAGKLSGAALEAGPVWWTGEALWWLIAKPESRLVDLTGLHQHPYVINAWTHAVAWGELAFGLLIFNRWARPPLLALATVLWISLAAVTGFVPFCATMIFANAAFISPAALRRWFGGLGGADPGR